MEIVISFIGLMLLVQVQSGGPYHAIIPKWEQNDPKFCGVQIMEHAAYIRVPIDNNQVVSDKNWPEKGACDAGLKCMLYKFPFESALTINPGFTPMAQSTTPPLPCFVPNLKNEGLVADNTLHPNALKTLSIVDYEIPKVPLIAWQFANDMIYVKATLRPPQGTLPQDIHVIATQRGTGTQRELVLKAGTPIDLIDLPTVYAGGDYNRKVSDIKMSGHFFFLHKLLANVKEPRDCQLVPYNAPSNCPPGVRNHNPSLETTLNLNCGPGGP